MKILGLLILMLGFTQLVTADDPPLVSICDIQQYNGIAPGDRVMIEGVCIGETGRYGSTTTVLAQEGGGPWCAIWVYVTDADLLATRGQCATVVGIVQEYYDFTEIFVGSTETIRPSVEDDCFDVPPPIYLQTGAAADEPYEACLVEVWCATVTEEPDDFGVFTLDDGSGPINGLLAQSWPPPALGDFYCSFRGILDYAWNQFRIRPRDLEDMDTTPQGDCLNCNTPPPPTPTTIATTTPTIPSTSTPTNTPTHQESPTATPTSEATVTTTPEPSPTPPPGTTCAVELVLNLTYFRAGDPFALNVVITPYHQTLSDLFFVVLDVYGSYFMYPGWTDSFQYVELNYPASELPSEILSFQWPTGAGAAEGLLFYSAVLSNEYTLVSNLDYVEFAFGE